MRGSGKLWLLFTLLTAYVSTRVMAAARINSFNIVDEARIRNEHRVAKYRGGQFLILRRGGKLTFRVNLDDALDADQSLTLQVAPFPIFDPEETHINAVGGGVYDIVTQVSTTAPVGSFSVGVRLSDRTFVVNFSRRVAVVFNPWHAGDLAHYKENINDLSEFIDNEHGITFRGSTRMVQSVRWYYAQFIPEVMVVAMHHLNTMDEASRKDPALVSRFFSAIAGYQNAHPSGLMIGRWEKTFPNGVNPSAWQGTDAILRMYLAQRFRPVQYAQCWVFAAILTTLLRALGIPARTISNFDSAHETPVAPMTYNQEILRYWDRNSRAMVAEVGMIWNFHAWTDVYLDNRYANEPFNGPGWQTIDGTPQELSDGKYQLGPAPVAAVRAMQKMRFDTSFVMSEVSSRIRNMMVQCPYFMGRQQFLPRGCKVTQDMGHEPRVPTGTIVSTKAVGTWGENRITAMYHTRSGGMATGNRAPAGIPANNANRVRTFAANRGEIDAVDPLPIFVPEYKDKEGGEVAVYHYDSTGISMGVSIAPTTIGQPLEIVVNFACEDKTDDFDELIRSRDHATRHALLGEEDAAAQKCPDIALVSFRLILNYSDYSGQDYEKIADVKANVVLRASNNHFKSFRFVSKDYVSKANFPISDYIRATVMATDHSTDPDRDVIIFGSQSVQLLPPKIELTPSRTIVATGHQLEPTLSTTINARGGVSSGSSASGSISVPASGAASSHISESPSAPGIHPAPGTNNNFVRELEIEKELERVSGNSSVRVNIRFVNPLKVDLTGCVLTLSADELGFEPRTIALRSIPQGSTFLYVHEFDTVGASPGTHYYHAVLTTTELPPIVGEVTFQADLEKVSGRRGTGNVDLDVDVDVLTV